MFRLKPISPDAIASALEKAHLYRTLNEPHDAESICRDVLAVDSENQVALVRLILSLTDQFRDGNATISQVEKLLPRVHSEYERWYFTGLAYERWAKTNHVKGAPGRVATEWYMEALRAFGEAERLRPPGNDDAILRWNSVVRNLRADEQVQRKFRHYSMGLGPDKSER